MSGVLKEPSKPSSKTSLTLLISRMVGYDSPMPALVLCFLKQDMVCTMDLRLAALGTAAGELLVKLRFSRSCTLKSKEM